MSRWWCSIDVSTWGSASSSSSSSCSATAGGLVLLTVPALRGLVDDALWLSGERERSRSGEWSGDGGRARATFARSAAASASFASRAMTAASASTRASFSKAAPARASAASCSAAAARAASAVLRAAAAAAASSAAPRRRRWHPRRAGYTCYRRLHLRRQQVALVVVLRTFVSGCERGPTIAEPRSSRVV